MDQEHRTNTPASSLKIDRLPGTLRVETAGGLTTPVIPQDTRLPTGVTSLFSNERDDQTQVEIHLLWGENPRAADNISLGKFVLDQLPPAPRATLQISVHLYVDDYARLTVTATEQSTNRMRRWGPIDLVAITPPPAAEFKSGPGGSRQLQLAISLAEAVGGVEKEIQITRLDLCPRCHGSGIDPNQQAGGPVSRARDPVTGAFVHHAARLIDTPCPECRGEKRVRVTRKVALKIPAGVSDGAQIRFAGLGAASLEGSTTGDLYVAISVLPHPFFTRSGDHIHLRLPITADLALRGGQVRVPTPTGENFLLVMVPYRSQAGDAITVPGKGAPNLKSKQRGDLIVRLEIYSPSSVPGEVLSCLQFIRQALGGLEIEVTER